MFATAKGTVKAIRKKSPGQHINDMHRTENPLSQKDCKFMSPEQLQIKITCHLMGVKGCYPMTIEKNCMQTRVKITCRLTGLRVTGGRGCHSMTPQKNCMQTQHNLRPWSLAQYVTSMQNFSLYYLLTRWFRITTA